MACRASVMQEENSDAALCWHPPASVISWERGGAAEFELRDATHASSREARRTPDWLRPTPCHKLSGTRQLKVCSVKKS